MSQDGPEEQSKPVRSESEGQRVEQNLSRLRKMSLPFQSFDLSKVAASLPTIETKFSPDDLEEIEENQRGLFIDFDQTIVNGHWHNEIMNNFMLAIQESEDQFKSLMEKFGLKNPNEMCNLIRDALNNGHHVAVLTGSLYIKLVPLALESMGLTQEEIRKIYIKNGPEKNILIQDAKKYFNIRNYNSTLLLDDTLANCQAAEKIGCQTIAVPSENNPAPTYFMDEKTLPFVERQEKKNKLRLG